MNKEQIKFLKLLGYKDTQEDGAILEHPRMWKQTGTVAYVWEDDKFVDVVEEYTAKIEMFTLKRAAMRLQKMAWEEGY